jgi:Pyruvate/2-oxoacid:ferredoxin oxidoreductase delta subunit
MKIYINNKKCTGCEKDKADCPRDPRIYSIDEKTEKICILKGSSYCLGCRIFVTVCLEDATPLRTDF